MQRGGLIRAAAAAGLVAITLGNLAGAACAQERVRWKLTSSYPSTLDVLGKNILRVIDNIKVMTDGNFDIKFSEPGALVPALEVFDAISKGSIEAAYTSTGFHAGRVPHMTFFSSVPFGPGVNEYVAWIHHAGGKQLYDESYAEPVRHRGRRVLGLVPQGNYQPRRFQGPEDALFRPRRQSHGQARRVHPAAGPPISIRHWSGE